jgi:acyl-CoA dehydrogenase
MLLDLAHASVQRRPLAAPAETRPPEPLAHIICHNTPVQWVENPYPVSLLHLVALARSAQMSGAIDAAHALTVRYAQERAQFGRKLASFQAIAQQLAQAAGEAAMARMAVEVAARSLGGIGVTPPTLAGESDEGNQNSRPSAFHCATAKVISGEAATQCAAICHQVHGAIGYTEEYALHHFTTRLWAWRREAGSEAFWAERLGREVVAAGSAGFWPGVTAGGFAPPA